MRYISIIFVSWLVLFFFPITTWAVSVTLSNLPPVIGSDDFIFSASISGATSGTNYLRVDVFKDGTNNFFGETYTGTDWYGGTEFNRYQPISIQSGIIWSGQLRARIVSPSSSVYDGLGIYKLRVRRYTASGNYNTDEANTSAIVVAVVYPTITPTPTETPVPIQTPSPTPIIPTPFPPTSKPSPIPTAVSVKPTVMMPSLSGTQLSSSVIISPTDARISEDSQPEILGVTAPVAVTAEAVMQTPHTNARNPFGIMLVGLGGIFLLACGILAFYTYRN